MCMRNEKGLVQLEAKEGSSGQEAKGLGRVSELSQLRTPPLLSLLSPSSSPYANPPVLISQPSESHRFSPPPQWPPWAHHCNIP